MPFRNPGHIAGARSIALAVVFSFAACGGGDAGDTGDGGVEAGSEGGLAVCGLLTGDEVASVLPGHDGGIVTSDGGSLIDGVDTYQCSYTATGADAADFDLLTVIVTIASTADLFEEVRPTPGFKRDIYANFTELTTGDGGFTYGEPDDTMVDVWQGTTVVSLELLADDAGTHTDELAALAATALSKAMM